MISPKIVLEISDFDQVLCQNLLVKLHSSAAPQMKAFGQFLEIMLSDLQYL